MNVWIEVSSEYRFTQKLKGESGLVAPASTRYINMLEGVKPGDIVLHYITASGCVKNEYRSSIVGVSRVVSKMSDKGDRVAYSIKDTIELPIPIAKDEIKSLDNKSKTLQQLIRVNFQRYIIEITPEDLLNIMRIHALNFEHMKTLKSYNELLV